jgi:uncharacterized RDD family membrane protein YckC
LFCPNCGKPVGDDARFCSNCGSQLASAQSKNPASASQGVGTGFDVLTRDSEAQTHWVSRLIAFAIDVVIIGVILLIVFGILTLYVFFLPIPGFLSNPVAFLFGVGALGSLSGGLLMVLYATLTEAFLGSTLGKKFLNIKVERIDGKKVTAREAFVRNIAKIHWLLLLIDLFAGLFTQGDYRQRFTDRVAGTIVVKRQ